MSKAAVVESERELVVRTAGALPVVEALCDRLGLAEAVDRLCPIRSVAEYTHGQVVEALVANRLTRPRPLSSFSDWGERFAVQETLGIAPVKPNDDRLGRTLDALAAQLDGVLGAIARRAVESFGLELAELHWDLTQLSFTGGYVEQEDGYARVRYGRTPKRTIERQVHAGFWVTSDGGVALRGQGFDGNTEDRQAVGPALERLDALPAALPQSEPPLVVGDSKVLSAGNVRAFAARKLRFCCPHPKDGPLLRTLAALVEDDFRPVAYAAERHRDKPPRYLVQEGAIELAGQELHPLFVLSLDDREAARKQRHKQRARAEEEIARLNRGVRQFRRTAADVERRAQAILEHRRLDGFLHLSVIDKDDQPQAPARPRRACARRHRNARRGATAWSATTAASQYTSSSAPTRANT